MNRGRKIGIGLLVSAFVPYAIAVRHATRYNWPPLDYPVELHRGAIDTPEFSADVSGRYILYLEVKARKIDFQRQECLLDLELFDRDKCAAIPTVINLSWTLWRGTTPAANNNSLETWRAGSYSNGYTRREIGRFDAQEGERYHLSLEFVTDPSELNIASPRIVVESMQDWEGYAIETQGGFALGVLGAIAGIVCLVAGRRR